jgi:hypothetical protein
MVDAPAIPGRRLTTFAGWLLVALGALIAVIGYSFATTEFEGINYGPAFAPYLYGLSLPPLLAGIGTLRHRRWAYVLGIVVGLVYGITLLAVSHGATPPLIYGLGSIGAALLLIDAARRRAVG